MSYVFNGTGVSECDPSWVEWAEHETVNRLRDQLTELRVARELRRAAELEAAEIEATPPAPPAAEAPSHEPAVRHSLSAMNAPPDPSDAEWETWAEAQTVLRLRRQREMKAEPSPLAPMSEPMLVSDSSADAERAAERPSELDLAPRRTIRIHHDNLRTVGV